MEAVCIRLSIIPAGLHDNNDPDVSSFKLYQIPSVKTPSVKTRSPSEPKDLSQKQVFVLLSLGVPPNTDLLLDLFILVVRVAVEPPLLSYRSI